VSHVDQMLLFAKVVEEGSFTAVARELDASRSLISKRIARLEDRLGVRLLNRTTRSLSLTESGSVYYDYCVRVRQALQEAEVRMAEMGGSPRGRLRVTMPVTYGELYVTPLLADFLSRYPSLSLDLHMDDRFVDMVRESYDVALRIGELDDSTLVARRLGTTRLLLCAAPQYLSRNGQPRTATDLVNHNCLTYRHERTRSSEWVFASPAERRPVPVSGNLRCNSGKPLREAALGGLGIAHLPDFMIGQDLQSGRLLEILPELAPKEIGIYAVYPHQQNLPEKVRAFVEFLADRLTQNRSSQVGN